MPNKPKEREITQEEWEIWELEGRMMGKPLFTDEEMKGMVKSRNQFNGRTTPEVEHKPRTENKINRSTRKPH